MKSKNYWLLKSEPDAFSIDDLKKVKTEPWSGVRNLQARNFMRDEMKKGDLCFFYHSSCEVPGIVGICEITTDPYLDPAQFDKQSPYFDAKSTKEKQEKDFKNLWFCVDVKFVKKFSEILTLTEIKRDPKLAGMRVAQKGSRLSVQPVSAKDFDYICNLLKN